MPIPLQTKGLQPLANSPSDKGLQPLPTPPSDKGLQPLVSSQAQPLVSPQVWFVTFVTHCSRVSERMVEFGVTDADGKGLQPLVLSPDDQVLIAESLFDTAERQGFAFIALNVLPDHVHALMPAPDEKTLSDRVRSLKVFSARAFQQAS